MAASIGWRYVRRIPGADGDEILSIAGAALCEAAAKWLGYCAARGFSPWSESNPDQVEGHFGGYVVKTVNGRILDWCRSQDFMPRHTRAVLKEIQAAAETGARTGAELSAATGLTAEQVRKAQAAEAVRPCSMNDIPDFSSHSGLADASADVESEVAAKAMFSAAVGVFDSLPAETQVVLALRYYGELDFAVIGKEMRTSQARVIELHNEGVTAVHQALLRQAQGEGSGPRLAGALPPVLRASSADNSSWWLGCGPGETVPGLRGASPRRGVFQPGEGPKGALLPALCGRSRRCGLPEAGQGSQGAGPITAAGFRSCPEEPRDVLADD